MNRMINKVVEIDGGALTTYSGDYEFYEQQRALNEKQQQAQFERQQAMLAKEIKFIERFKARASHAAQVQSRVKKLDKIERVEPPKRRQTVAFEFLPAPRSGEDVVSLKNVHKGYGSRTIYQGLDFMIRRKERWCVMGVNGAGKSTLLKLVAGSTEPDDGTVAVGGSVKMGYFAQHAMDLLDGERTVFQSLEDSFPQAGQGSLRALAGCFGFSGDDVEKKCRVLSGGEAAGLGMARMLFRPPDFLVLDEPTHHPGDELFARERRDCLDLVGPDAAGIVLGQPCKLLRRIYSGRELATAIGAEHEDLAVGGFHAVQETVRPAPHPRGDVDRQHHHRVAAGFRHHAAPAIADVAEQAGLDRATRDRPDVARALAHDLDRLVAAID